MLFKNVNQYGLQYTAAGGGTPAQFPGGETMKTLLMAALMVAASLTGCATTKPEPEPSYPPISPEKRVLIASQSPAELRMTAQNGSDLNICAGTCLTLLARAGEPRFFFVRTPQEDEESDTVTIASASAGNREARTPSSADHRGEDKDVKPEERVDADPAKPALPNMESKESPQRTLRKYERK